MAKAGTSQTIYRFRKIPAFVWFKLYCRALLLGALFPAESGPVRNIGQALEQ